MPDLLTWLDLEMTGLDLGVNRIVEGAVVVTDTDLNVVHEGFEVVIYQPRAVLAASSEFAMEAHTASGLYEKVRASLIDETEACELIIKYLLRQGVVPGGSPVCGNSIWQDRKFISAQMPALDAFLNHRTIDVSTLKLLGKYWNPPVFAGMPKKAKGHRALDDIRESIVELQYYRDTLVVTADA